MPDSPPPRWEALGPQPLQEAEVHVIAAVLSHGAGGWALLAPDERARALRLRRARDRDRFVAAHAALRRILGLYTGERPDAVRLVPGAGGKPALAGGGRLRFSLSHSRDLALVALARDREVGVDVEALRPGLDLAALAREVCSPREQEALAALPPVARGPLFFQWWTRKEAVLKAVGEGLHGAAARIEVVGPPDGRGRRFVTAGGVRHALWDLPDLEGHAAAAAAREGGSLRCFRASPDVAPVAGP